MLRALQEKLLQVPAGEIFARFCLFLQTRRWPPRPSHLLPSISRRKAHAAAQTTLPGRDFLYTLILSSLVHL